MTKENNMGLDRQKIHEHIDDALPTHLDVSKFEITRKDNCFSVTIEMSEPQKEEQIFVKACKLPEEKREVFVDEQTLRKIISNSNKKVKETFDIDFDHHLRTSSSFTPEEKKNLQDTASNIAANEKKNLQDDTKENDKFFSNTYYKHKLSPKPTLKELSGRGAFTRKGSEFDDDAVRNVKSPVEAENTWAKAKERYESVHKRKCNISIHKKTPGLFMRSEVSETEIMADSIMPKIKLKDGYAGSSFIPKTKLSDGYVGGSFWESKAETKPSDVNNISVEDDVLNYLEITKSFVNRNIDKAILWIKKKKSEPKKSDTSKIKEVLDEHFNRHKFF